jgi:hypothetical protein
MNVTMASAPTLQRLLTYIYTGDYDDGSSSRSAVQEDTVRETEDRVEDEDIEPARKRLKT